MKKMKKVILFLLAILFVAMPFLVGDAIAQCAEKAGSGGLIPCGKSVNDPDTSWNECAECNACSAMLMGQLIIEFFVKVAATVAVLVIVIGGLLYMFAAGNTGALDKAKFAIKASLIGFIIVFIAWAVVDSALIMFGYIDPMSGDDWQHVSCELGTLSSVTPSDCEITCTTVGSGPGCLPALADGKGAFGSCCGTGFCYDCKNGFKWNGTNCSIACGDDICDEDLGECSFCVADCDIGDCCGNGTCDAAMEENCSNCSDCDCLVPNICCSGVCESPRCSINDDCDDRDDCTENVCNNPGTCTASCSNPLAGCSMVSDNCCPAGCTHIDDSDCECMPNLTCAVDYVGQCGIDLWNGCANELDCSGNCGSQLCCSGVCQDSACDNGGDCTDGDNCTTDICSNAGDCTASCSHVAVAACVDADGCCPAGCDATSDSDCGSSCTPSLTCAADYVGQCGVNLSDGCANVLDCSGNCGAQLCCSGTCQDSACDNDSDCLDSNGCTADETCNNAGTCTASCSYSTTTTCTDDDDCCPVGCDATSDNNCDVISDSFDWSHRELPGALPVGTDDWMSPVKMQRCGSCWAYGAIGAVEAKYNLEQNDATLDIDLSEGYLVSTCCSAGDCGGGWPDWALGCIRNAGVPDDACFPQSGSDDPCNLRCADWSTRLWKINSVRDSDSSSRETMKNAIVNTGPIAGYVKIAGAGDGFVDGIYRCSSGGPTHAIIIVGYNETEEYWVVKNSWGSSYDGNGYYKVGYGECAIESWGYSYPVGVTGP